jgi:hypothetical protein
MASAIPAIAMKFPERAPLGFERPFSAKMKVMAATR